jgi:hypothetical protein
MGAVPLTWSAAGFLDFTLEEPQASDLSGVGKGERILDIDAEILRGALDLRLAEKEVHGSQVAGLLVDDRRRGSAKRMRPVILSV